MPKLVAGLMALVALGSGLATGIDPMTCLARGGIAFAVGWVLASLWTAFIPPPTSVLTEEAASEGPPESEPGAAQAT